MFKPLQLGASKALKCDKSWYQKLNTTYRKRQKLALEIFNKLKVEHQKNQSGMFVWGKIPGGFSDSYNFSDHYLDQQSVFITPGAIFGNNGKKHVRISLCSPRKVQLLLLQIVVS